MNDVIVPTMAYLASGLIVNHAQWLSKFKDLFGEEGPELERYYFMVFFIVSSSVIFIILFVLHIFGLGLPMPPVRLGVLGSILGAVVAILLWRTIKAPVAMEIEITERIVHERRILTALHTISVVVGCLGVGVLLEAMHALITGSDSPWRWYHGVVLIWLCGIFAAQWVGRTLTLINLVRSEIKKR